MTSEEILQAFDDINFVYNDCTKYDTLKRMLEELTERKRGEWIGKPLGGYSTVHCSVCRSAFLENSGRWNYCSNCGADMRGDEDDKG